MRIWIFLFFVQNKIWIGLCRYVEVLSCLIEHAWKDKSIVCHTKDFICSIEKDETLCVHLISKRITVWTHRKDRCIHNPWKQTAAPQAESRTWEQACTWQWILHWTLLPSFRSSRNRRNLYDIHFNRKKYFFFKS